MAAPVERLYCKRPILWLASSKILTPHPPPNSALRLYRTSGVIFFIDYCTAIRDT